MNRSQRAQRLSETALVKTRLAAVSTPSPTSVSRWAYLASLQGVVLQLVQEEDSRLRLGESQRLGGRREACRVWSQEIRRKKKNVTHTHTDAKFTSSSCFIELPV